MKVASGNPYRMEFEEDEYPEDEDWYPDGSDPDDELAWDDYGEPVESGPERE